MSDRVGMICQQLNADTANALRGIAQPLADEARAAQASAEAYQREHYEALNVMNGSDVASRGEIQNELSLSGKARHLRFIAEAAERAEEELCQEVVELRQHVADLSLIVSEIASRRCDQAA